jgi:small subunit ribosomal protein S16
LDEPATVSLNDERVLYWLSQGAEPSDTVRSILGRQGLMLAFHLKRKGSEEEAVWEAVRAHRERHAQLEVAGKKTTVGDRREEALKAEYAAAASAEAVAAKARAEADARAKADADAARQKAQEDAQAERDAAAAAAKVAQEARNVEQTTEDAGAVASDTSTPDADADLADQPK